MSEETCKENKDKRGKLKKPKEVNDLRGSAGSRRDHKKISGEMRQLDT